MLHLVGIGAGDDHAVIALVGQGGPHLLAVDDPFVTVEFGLGLQAGDVGSGAGLGEHLAPHRLAGDVVGEESLLLLVGAVLGEHRHAHAVGDDELAVGHRVVALDLAPDLLVGEGEATTAVLLRHGETGEAGVGRCGEERLLVVERRVLTGCELLHEVDALLAELGGFGLAQSSGRFGGGVGHVRSSKEMSQRSAVAILYGTVQYVSRRRHAEPDLT